jgi:hypothetical protein
MNSITVVETVNFVKWIFRGILREPGFYGFVIAMMGVVAELLGCPGPYPKYMYWTGLGTLCVLGGYYVIRMMHALYRLDQSRLFDILRNRK